MEKDNVVVNEVQEYQTPTDISTTYQAANSFMQLIERCMTLQGLDPANISRMIDLQERLLAKHAESEFTQAFAMMQPELPPIPALGTGHNNKAHFRKADANQLINPILAKYGFALSYVHTQQPGMVLTRAILRHKGGHSTFTEALLPPDASGSKNPVQAIGSTMSYGERYTMKAILNLTIVDDPTDDDGVSASSSSKKKATSQFQEKVDRDTKKNQTPIVKNQKIIVNPLPAANNFLNHEPPAWDRKTIIMPGDATIVRKFSSSKEAAEELLKQLTSIENKITRVQIININLPIIKALVKAGQGQMVEALHKCADEGK